MEHINPCGLLVPFPQYTGTRCCPGFELLRASTAGLPKCPLYVRADGLVSDRSQNPDPAGLPKPVADVRADRHPSNPAQLWGGYGKARTRPPGRTGPPWPTRTRTPQISSPGRALNPGQTTPLSVSSSPHPLPFRSNRSGSGSAASGGGDPVHWESLLRDTDPDNDDELAVRIALRRSRLDRGDSGSSGSAVTPVAQLRALGAPLRALLLLLASPTTVWSSCPRRRRRGCGSPNPRCAPHAARGSGRGRGQRRRERCPPAGPACARRSIRTTRSSRRSSAARSPHRCGCRYSYGARRLRSLLEWWTVAKREMPKSHLGKV